MPPMGRHRRANLELPPRMRFSRGKFYYDAYAPGMKRHWIALGDNIKSARSAWSNLMNAGGDTETFGALCDKYIAECINGLANSTRSVYTHSAGVLHKVFGHEKLSAIKPEHIGTYLDSHPKASSANNQIMLMGLMFEKAMRWGWTTTNPCRGIRKNKLKKRDRYVEDAEFLAVRATAQPYLQVCMNLAYITSMGVSDVAKLALTDLNDEGLYSRRKKTGKRQLFVWTDDLRAVVATAKALPRIIGSLYLIPRRDGQPYTPNTIQIAMRAACARAGVEPFHFHDIRAKAATDAERNGEDFFKLLGHAHRATSEGYVKARKTEHVKSGRKVL